MRRRAAFRTTLLLVAVALAPRPAAAQRWYDHYERGLRALEEGDAAEAVRELERAIRKHPEPGERVLTYGTNRLARYHPYLKLAEAYLMLGQPEAAAEALRRSRASGREPDAARRPLLRRLEALRERRRRAAATPTPTPAPTPSVAEAAPPAPSPTAVPTPVPAAADSGAPGADVAATPEPPRQTQPRATPTPTGSLRVRTTPADVTVLVGERVLGVTPLEVELEAGLHEVTLRREGEDDLRFPVRVAADRSVTVERDLRAATAADEAPLAELILFSDPGGAEVYVDDVRRGATDGEQGRLVLEDLEPGTRRLRLSRDGYDDAVRDVAVQPGPPTVVRLSLDPGRRWNARTIAAAVLVLAALAGVVLAVRRRRPRSPDDVETRRVESPTGGGAAAGASPPAGRTGGGPVEPDGEAATVARGDTPPARAQPRESRAGEAFGEYALVETLGKGGMAWVFKARRGSDVVALKRPLSSFVDDAEFRQRFLREAEIGRTLHHPNIIRIYERGEVDEVPYFTMELVEGETLQAWLRRERKATPRRATTLVSQVAEALDYAHLKGVVHRDLKPSNIMLLGNGVVKVMDYGIARAQRLDGLTATGTFLGTPEYVAPETVEGRPVDARSDLYSLGVIFYELLTGQQPFVGATPFMTLRMQCSDPPTPPSSIAPGCPRELEALILRLMAKKPEQRPESAEVLLIALRDYLNRTG